MEIRKWVVRWYALYSQTLEKYPVTTQMSTSAVLWFAGDFAAQQFEMYGNERKHKDKFIQRMNNCRDQLNDSETKNSDRQCLLTEEEAQQQGVEEKGTKFDTHRSFIQTFYGSVLWAPIAHYWYEGLDKVAHRIAPISKSRRLATKFALEVVALHPLALLAFFTSVGYMNGETSDMIVSQLKRDFIPTLGLELALWTPLDLFNFAFIPVRHQLLVVNCGCFFESSFLSFIKVNGISLPGEGH
mmetsp:Transcript_1640/g.2211  ORF Transcript_1640/g.2211 Transcript_1640/m.2211 type:complete len:242 (+) Transcript_1640:96-821(+)